MAYTDTDPTENMTEQEIDPISMKAWKKAAVMLIICSAQLFNIFNSSVSIVALPTARYLRLSTIMFCYSHVPYT